MTPSELIELIKQQTSLEAVKQVIELWEEKKELNTTVEDKSPEYIKNKLALKYYFDKPNKTECGCEIPDPNLVLKSICNSCLGYIIPWHKKTQAKYIDQNFSRSLYSQKDWSPLAKDNRLKNIVEQSILKNSTTLNTDTVQTNPSPTIIDEFRETLNKSNTWQ